MSTDFVKELDIWTQLIQPDSGEMSPAEASAVLNWQFDEQARSRMEDLMARHNEGLLSESERSELEAFVNVGQVVAILQVKARLAMQNSDGTEN